ncbi:helix-turn-helix transcriptional regulator [Embleya sp. NPDC020630]|uniref:helix-turn-helix transcriptional regulator n=1 Tax=Embleya sp. NPDC020630 TaxID=3363979 RepID=UPI0037A4D142
MTFKRHRLVQRRESRGFTQESLAERLGVDRTTIARWENGKGPQPWMRPNLARALSLSQEELDTLLRDVGDCDRSPVVGGLGHGDPATGAAFRADLLDVAERYDNSPSAGLLADAGRLLTRVTMAADQARAGRAQRELRSLQAEAATLMGQLVWDASQRSDHTTAHTYYAQGIDLARHLHDRTLEGRALLRTGYLALYGTCQPQQGLDYSLRAAEAAKTTSPALLAVALLHVGEAHAMLGHATDCERALAQAERHLDRVTAVDAAADLVSPTQFGRLAGSCYLNLGQNQRAQQQLQSTAEQLPARRKSRTIVLGNLTLALIRQGELDNAVSVLGQAIDELEQTRGGGGMNVIFAAGRELRPWHRRVDVQDVQDRLFTLMTAT